MLLLRRLCHSLAILAVSSLVIATGRADAETYPSNKITLVVAFAAGGVADTLARMVGQGLSERLHQAVVVENRGGAGGNIAAGVVAHSAPDGYTLLVTTTALAINETLRETKQFSASDFKTIAIVASSPEALVTEATHVPFQGGAPAINATLGNQIDLLATTLGGGAAAQITAGKLKGLGIASDMRAAVTPNVPTYAESGFPGFFAASWVGFFAPAGTDPQVVAKLNEAINNTIKDADVQQKLATIGFDPINGSPAQAEAMFKAEVNKWGEMVKALNLSIK